MAKYEVKTMTQFRRDLKLAKKRGLQLPDLFDVVEKLSNDEPLPEQNRDHALHGDYEGYRECHSSPDWLLVYVKDTEICFLTLYRTGTHSDIFGKGKKR